MRGLSLAVESRGYSVAAVGGLSMASSVAEHRQALEQVGFSSFRSTAPTALAEELRRTGLQLL